MSEKLKKIAFVEDGDKELWLIKGDDWCLPIYAIPRKAESYNRVWFIEPAVQIDTSAKYKKLLDVVRPHSLAAKTLVISTETLEQIATKAPGITPRYYAKWAGRSESEPQIKAYETDEVYRETVSSQFDSFLRFVESETQVASFATIKLVMIAVRRCAVAWLLEKRKPIDFGFCKVHAFPLRNNWKVFMDVWHPHAAEILKRRPEVARAQMTDIGFGEDLASPMILSVDESRRHVNWTLDIEEMPEFYEEAERQERARRAHLGDVRYYSWVKNTIGEMYNALFEVYSRWARAASRPNGEVRDGFRTSAEILLPTRKRARILPQNATDHGVAAQRFKIEGPTVQRTGANKIEKVRPVQYLQPPD